LGQQEAQHQCQLNKMADKEIKKQDEKIEKTEEKKEVETSIVEEKKEEKIETKVEEKKKEQKKEKIKKSEAHIDVQNVRISKKQSMAICDWIRGKQIDESIIFLGDVIKQKKALPMKGEIPHRKGPMQSGRFPVVSSREFIKLLKSLKSNALQNGLDVDKAKIIKAIPNLGNRPLRRGGREKAKRTHVYLELREVNKENKENK